MPSWGRVGESSVSGRRLGLRCSNGRLGRFPLLLCALVSGPFLLVVAALVLSFLVALGSDFGFLVFRLDQLISGLGRRGAVRRRRGALDVRR